MARKSRHTGGTTSVVGVTIQGPPPLGTIHLPWTPGLNVLYGANGAGKTSILSAIQNAFAGLVEPGEDTVALIHLATEGWWDDEFGDGEDYEVGEPTSWIRDFLDELNDATMLHDRASDEPRFQDEELAPVLENATTGGLLAQAVLFGTIDHLGKEMLLELLDDPFVTLAAVGTTEPKWVLYSSALPQGESSVSGKYLKITQAFASMWDSIPEDRHALLVEWLTDQTSEVPEPLAGLREKWDEFEPGLRKRLGGAAAGIRTQIEHPERPGSPLRLRSGVHVSDLAFKAKLPLPFMLWNDFHETPDWVPVPFVDLGYIDLEDGMHVVASDAVGDINTHTWQWINNEHLDGVSEWPVAELSMAVEVHGQEIGGYANSFIDAVIPIMPVLAWSTPAIGELRQGHLIAWKGVDPSSGDEISLEHLSAAQQRWLRLAIAVGITRLHTLGEGSALLIDEPELALHRRATRQVATSLAAYAHRWKLSIFVASHSAEFLAEPNATLYHVSRQVPGDGRTTVIPIGRQSLLDAAELLDLEPGELLQMVRSFVLVEGEHDVAVLGEIVGERLEDVGTKLVPMRGSDNLDSLLENNLLFTYTTAQVVVILDGITDTVGLAEAWDEARASARDGDFSLAKGHMNRYRSSLGRRIKEQDQLINFAIRSLATGFYDRIELHGFTRRDIIEYLDPSTFGLEETWDELSAEYRKYRDVNTRPLSYKNWLGIKKQALFNTETIRASASLRGVEDADEFMNLIDRLTLIRRAR